MLELFFPKLYVNTVFDVPYAKLLERNVRGLIFDIDNTLSPFDVTEPGPEVISLMRRLAALGFQLCLLSNNNQKRVELYNQKLKLPMVTHAKKPLSTGVKKAMRLMGTAKDNTAIIGDQIFTDIWSGKNAKIVTILVKPMSDRDEFTVRIKRGLERKVVERYLQQGGELIGANKAGAASREDIL